MLLLTRHQGQAVYLYDAAGRYVGRIKVLQVAGKRVELGFEVDGRFIVLREELLTGGVPAVATVRGGPAEPVSSGTGC